MLTCFAKTGSWCSAVMNKGLLAIGEQNHLRVRTTYIWTKESHLQEKVLEAV